MVSCHIFVFDDYTLYFMTVFFNSYHFGTLQTRNKKETTNNSLQTKTRIKNLESAVVMSRVKLLF